MWNCCTLLSILLLSLGAVHATILSTILNGGNCETRFRCYDGSFSDYYDFCFDNPTPMLNSSCFNSSRQTVFCTYGFEGNNTGPYVQALVEALLPSYNVILAIWEKYASSGILGDLGYVLAANNALIYGKECGEALVPLFDAGLILTDVRLIGFSLGAHFMGAAAQACQTAGFQINLVIGLDPAGPLFNDPGIGGISPTDATTVLVIHTNPGRLGTINSKGTVDLWMNCGNAVQPGCAAAGSGIGVTTPGNLCSHDRSWQYLIDAWQNQNTFQGRIAQNCDDWRNGNGGNQTYTLGNDIVTGVQGNFYMSTNSAYPYGRSEAGLNA